MSESQQPESPEATRGVVAKNALYLSLAQVLGMPLALLFNAIWGRYLGSKDFGALYLATTIASFGFLVVEWGHAGALPAAVATNRERAGGFLGASIAWRLVMGVVVYFLLALGCRVLGYSSELQWALAAICLMRLTASVAAAYQETVRGFERADLAALGHLGARLADVLVVLPVLFLGGNLHQALIADCVGTFLATWFIVRAGRRMGARPLHFDRAAFKQLFNVGSAFVVCGVAMALQPNVDAYFLAKGSPEEVMGWFAVSRQLIGVLIFPAAALIGALYPTLCRLWITDKAEFANATEGSLRAVALLAFPVALCCGFFPELGVSIFSQREYGPAADNLRIGAINLFLVYFTMPLGVGLMASGRQGVWAGVQALCVVVSLALDPLLIPWFQAKMGNGGLGVSTAGVASEVVMLVFGLALAPSGVLTRKLGRSLLLGGLAGAALGAVAWLGRGLPPLAVAPFAIAAYVAVLWFTGGIEKEHVAAISSFVNRKLARLRARAAQ